MLQRPGAWVASRWLDKEVLDLLGARAEVAATEAEADWEGEGGRGRGEGRGIVVAVGGDGQEPKTWDIQ